MNHHTDCGHMFEVVMKYGDGPLRLRCSDCGDSWSLRSDAVTRRVADGLDCHPGVMREIDGDIVRVYSGAPGWLLKHVTTDDNQ